MVGSKHKQYASLSESSKYCVSKRIDKLLFAGYNPDKEYSCTASNLDKCSGFSKLMYLIVNVRKLQIPLNAKKSEYQPFLDIHQVITSYIILHKDEIDAVNEEGWTALMIAVFNCGKLKLLHIVRLLVELGANINTQNQAGLTALMMGCWFCLEHSDIAAVEFLLESGADHQLKDCRGDTALSYSCKKSRLQSSNEVIRLLLKYHADINSQNRGGDTAVIYAAQYAETSSSIETLQLLLEAGADITIQNNLGWNALIACCIHLNYSGNDGASNMGAFNMLMRCKININTQTTRGNTALMCLCGTDRLEANIDAVRLLILSGADDLIQNQNGLTMYQICTRGLVNDELYDRIRKLKAGIQSFQCVSLKKLGFSRCMYISQPNLLIDRKLSIKKLFQNNI